jgi:eukaryotic-like serine/threonine-protein kinase
MHRIGQYEIRELLGEGGVGKVHAAVDTELDREVAIKSLRPEFVNDDSFVKRFRGEAKNLANLNHPNIATLFSLFREGNNLYMVMERVRGRTLDDIISKRNGPLGVKESLAIIAQACEGISYAHSMHVIHRDIKPANLMVTESGLLKVMDFGIARARGSQRMTRHGSIVGTLTYMAPEQLRGQEGDERSDIYSLAIVLYEMLTGAPPFSADSDYELMQAQINKKPERLGSRVRGLDPCVESALIKALSKKPEQRFLSMTAFREALGVSALRTNTLQFVHDQTRIIGASAPQSHRWSHPFVALKKSLHVGLSRILDFVPRPANIRWPVVAGVVVLIIAAFVVEEVMFAPTLTPLSTSQPQDPASQSVQAKADAKAKADADERAKTEAATKAKVEARVKADADERAKTEAAAKAKADAKLKAEQTERALAEISSALSRNDFAKSLELARPLAVMGNPEAQRTLGFLYETGSGIRQNDQESVSWYRKSAEQGNAQAQFKLGLAYENGRGITQKYSEALRWHKQAVEQGSADSQNRLGIMYALGHGVDQNYAQAVAWYRKAADQKLPNAQKNLGDMYAMGHGVPQDNGEALLWYRQAAAQNYADAEFNIGWWYENGRDVQSDPKLAADWYRKALEHGYSNAQVAQDALNRVQAGGFLKD